MSVTRSWVSITSPSVVLQIQIRYCLRRPNRPTEYTRVPSGENAIAETHESCTLTHEWLLNDALSSSYAHICMHPSRLPAARAPPVGENATATNPSPGHLMQCSSVPCPR